MILQASMNTFQKWQEVFAKVVEIV